MQTSSYLPVLATIIPFVVEFVKTSPLFLSITPETKGKLMSLSAVLASVGGILAGLSDGSIDGTTVQVAVDSVWQASVAFGLTQGIYNVFKFLKVLGNN